MLVEICGGQVEIDPADAPLLASCKWSVTKEGYARGSRGLLHRVICGLKKHDPLVVDHKNGNRLDNQRSNLRVCTRRQNKANANPSSRNKSGVVGVSFWKNRWVVSLREGGRRYFDSKELAVEFKELLSEMEHGEFAFHLSRGSAEAESHV